MNGVRRGTSAMIAVVLAACTPNAPIGEGSNSPTPQEASSSSPSVASPTPSRNLPTPAPTVPPHPSDPDGWVRYRSDELGLSFPFPRMEGRSTFWVHRGYWNRHRLYSFTQMAHRSGSAFAGGTSYRASEARECTILDVVTWEQVDERYRIVGPNGKCSYDVDPLRIVDRGDARPAIVYRSDEFWEQLSCHRRDFIAVVPFPQGQHDEFNSITFNFDRFDDPECLPRWQPLEPLLPGFTLDDAETVIRGIRFFAPVEG